MDKKMVPEVRFKGFTDDWEQHKLGEFYNFKNGLNKEKAFFGSGVPIVNFVDVFHNRFLMPDMLMGRVTLTEKEIKSHEVKQGDIFFTRTSETINEIGYPSVMLGIPDCTVFSGFVLRGRAIGNDPLNNLFKSYIFFTEHFRKEMIKKSSMTTRALTSGTALKEMIIKFPVSENEQTNIGTLFKHLDVGITLQQLQIDCFLKLRKELIQQIFPSNKAILPKIRYANFSSSWEQHKLKEVTQEVNDKSSDGELLSVTINDGIVKNSTLERKNNSSKDKSKYKKVEIGDIAYNSMRMWQGASGISRYSGIVSPAYTVFRVNKNVLNNIFLGYLIKTPEMTWKFRINSQGLTSDTWNLKYPLFSEINIRIPSLKEQICLANLLRSVDKTIDSQQKQLKTLKSLKKYLLQKLFI